MNETMCALCVRVCVCACVRVHRKYVPPSNDHGGLSLSSQTHVLCLANKQDTSEMMFNAYSNLFSGIFRLASAMSFQS